MNQSIDGCCLDRKKLDGGEAVLGMMRKLKGMPKHVFIILTKRIGSQLSESTSHFGLQAETVMHHPKPTVGTLAAFGNR